jgi:phosphoribosylanthranilate isomerase
VRRLAVTHLETAREVLDLADQIGVDTIQLHGLMAPEDVAEVKALARGRRVVRAVHVVNDHGVAAALDLRGLCDAVVLDSRTVDRLGGTGQTHDWSISRQIRDALGENAEDAVPVILAGGLTPENVRDAVSAVRPYAVDVNSGVEDVSGDKDPSLCSAFVSSARRSLASAGMAAA